MKLIVVTPAGREKYLRLLSHYVLGSPEVDEWQLWDNCRNESDRAYVHKLSTIDSRCKLKQLPGADGNWGIIGDFFQFCDDPDALYLRLDDDIVFIENGFFPKFVQRANAERGNAIWFSPLVINNAICNFLLKHLSEIVISGPVTCQAMCPFSWAYPNLPEALHPIFIDAVRIGRLGDFRVPDRDVRMSRFSTNAIGFFGSDKIALGDMFMPPQYPAEEEWLSAILPAKIDRAGKIFGDLLVAHFSFYTQEHRLLQTAILDDYYRLANVRLRQFKRPRKESRRKILAGAWRRRKDDGPQYSVSFKETPPT